MENRFKEDDKVKKEKLQEGCDADSGRCDADSDGSDADTGSNQDYEDKNQIENFGSTICINFPGFNQQCKGAPMVLRAMSCSSS